MSQVVDLYLVYQFVKRLSTPFEETKAYDLGLIDSKGKRLKKASTRQEKDAMTYYDRLIFNLKRIISKAGIESKFNTFAAALFLLKEQNNNKKREDIITQHELMEFKEANMSLLSELVDMDEDAPVNAVGTGNIAGASPGEDPPITKRILKRYRKKVAKQSQQANTAVRKTFSQMRNN